MKLNSSEEPIVSHKKPDPRKLCVKPYPGTLENQFRRSLGKHNLHLNLLEISTRTFEQTLQAQVSEAKYIREMAKLSGFHSLHPEAVSFASAHRYLLATHIAYVISAGDALCKKIRDHVYMRHLKNAHKAIVDELNKGDFVKKTVNLTVLASLPEGHRSKQRVNACAIQIMKEPYFAVVDYYRLVRNEDLHSAEAETDLRATEAWDNLPIDDITNRYHFAPNKPLQLNANDALLCSKAWQDVAKWLCRHMFNDTDISTPYLGSRYGHLAIERRHNAAKNFMQQALLYSDSEITATMEALGWL